MAFAPITFVATNYRDYKNWWLKAYEPGTTTPKPMSDNDTGSPQAAKYEIDKDGWPVTSGSAIVNPHVKGDYDIWLFPTEEDADNNDTTNALRLADDLSSPGSNISGYSSIQCTSIDNAKSGITIGGNQINYEVGATVETLGYYSANDGGGEKYVVVAGGTGTVDNGEYHDTTNGLQLELITSSKIDIRAFGAQSGDDTISADTEINNAVAYAGRRGVNTVVCPPGDYYVLNIYMKRGVTLLGAVGETNFLNFDLPTIQGMIRADADNDASNCAVIGITCKGNGKVPANTALMKGIMFEEVQNFVCRDCRVEDMTSYGFWAHTNVDEDTNLCVNGLFENCYAKNTEHNFETKRGFDITFRDCTSEGGEYTNSAAHPWERSENIRYENHTVTGSHETVALILGASGTSVPEANTGNNKNIHFDLNVDIDFSVDGDARLCRSWRADDVFLKATGQCKEGISWQQTSGNLTLDIDDFLVERNIFISGSGETVTGVLQGKLRMRSEAPAGITAVEGFYFESTGGTINMNEVDIEVNMIESTSIRAFEIYGNSDFYFGKVKVKTNSTTRPVYIADSSGFIGSLDSESDSGLTSTAVTFDNSDLDIGRLKTRGGLGGTSLTNAANVRVDITDMSNRATLNLSGASKMSVQGGQILSDGSIANTADGVVVSDTSDFSMTGGELGLVNAAGLDVAAEIISTSTTAKLRLNGVKLSSDQAANDVKFSSPNTMVTNVFVESVNALNFTLEATANDSMFTNNIVKTATVDNSTGSTVSEIVQ